MINGRRRDVEMKSVIHHSGTRNLIHHSKYGGKDPRSMAYPFTFTAVIGINIPAQAFEMHVSLLIVVFVDCCDPFNSNSSSRRARGTGMGSASAARFDMVVGFQGKLYSKNVQFFSRLMAKLNGESELFSSSFVQVQFPVRKSVGSGRSG